MYLEHFGLNAFPFSTAPDPRFYYPSAKHKEALACLLYAVEQKKGFALVTGEIGAGKTMLCRAALERLGDGVEAGFIVHTSLTPVQFLRTVSAEFRIEAEGRTKWALLRGLKDFLVGSAEQHLNVVLIVDEAQALSRDVLEEIRLLGNLETPTEKLIQIILVGQPELRDLIARRELRPLSQRIGLRFHLGTLSCGDVHSYIDHRLRVAGASEEPIFDTNAKTEVSRASGGIPRLVNVICDQALLEAYVRDESRVFAATVRSTVLGMDGYYMDRAPEPDASKPSSARSGTPTTRLQHRRAKRKRARKGSSRPPASCHTSTPWPPKPRTVGRPSLRSVRTLPLSGRLTDQSPRAEAPTGTVQTGELAETGQENPPMAPMAEPAEPRPRRFEGVDGLCGAIATGELRLEFMPHSGNTALASYRMNGAEVSVKFAQENGANYAILIGNEVGPLEGSDSMKAFAQLVAALGYVRVTDDAYLRQDGEQTYSLKLSPNKLGLACTAHPDAANEAVARCVRRLHEELSQLATAYAQCQASPVCMDGALSSADAEGRARSSSGRRQARISCPQCGTTIGIHEDEVGQSGTCPCCSTPILIPVNAFVECTRAPRRQSVGSKPTP